MLLGHSVNAMTQQPTAISATEWPQALASVGAIRFARRSTHFEPTVQFYRDPDGREVVFAPFIFGVNEPAESNASGEHRGISGLSCRDGR